MRIFSIDPGLSGAWALTIDGRPTMCGDMPTTGEGSQRRVAAAVLAKNMRMLSVDLCVIELVGAMPGNGVAGMFRFGQASGAAAAVPAVLEIPLEFVTPQKWKAAFGLKGKEKEASRQKAIDLCPWLSENLARKKDDGRAEAVLLGLHAASLWQSPISPASKVAA